MNIGGQTVERFGRFSGVEADTGHIGRVTVEVVKIILIGVVNADGVELGAVIVAAARRGQVAGIDVDGGNRRHRSGAARRAGVKTEVINHGVHAALHFLRALHVAGQRIAGFAAGFAAVLDVGVAAVMVAGVGEQHVTVAVADDGAAAVFVVSGLLQRAGAAVDVVTGQGQNIGGGHGLIHVAMLAAAVRELPVHVTGGNLDVLHAACAVNFARGAGAGEGDGVDHVVHAAEAQIVGVVADHGLIDLAAVGGGHLRGCAAGDGAAAQAVLPRLDGNTRRVGWQGEANRAVGAVHTAGFIVHLIFGENIAEFLEPHGVPVIIDTGLIKHSGGAHAVEHGVAARKHAGFTRGSALFGR